VPKMLNKKPKKNSPEVWLRGPIEGIPDLLQPAAHALLQSSEEIAKYLDGFPEQLLWQKTSGRATVGFHLLHITGVLDRMMTYARGKKLSEEQFEFLNNEEKAVTHMSSKKLIVAFEQKVSEALQYFTSLNESELTEARHVGRKKLPSTVIGLLFHAAEHSQRHVGQLLVTVSVLRNTDGRFEN